MKRLYIFKNPEHGSIAISATNLKEAMSTIEDRWYSTFFDYSFTVDIVHGMSGVQLN